MSIDYLAIKNAHPRDAYIAFDEPTHVYTITHPETGIPDSTFMSVTTWNHHHFAKFDSEKIVNQIISSRKHKTDSTYKYFQMTKDQILAMWDANRDQASGAGTNMHFDIECYYNQMPVTNESVEFTYFQNYLRDHPHLQAYRTEWTVFHEELKIAGSIDMVYENPDGTLRIYDWKRCKDIIKENPYGYASTTDCIAHLPDTNFWHYSLQLNTYKTILEQKYGKKVTELCLVALHPNNDNYKLIPVPFMEKELTDLFEYRRQMLLPKVASPNTGALKTGALKTGAPKTGAPKTVSDRRVQKGNCMINLNEL